MLSSRYLGMGIRAQRQPLCTSTFISLSHCIADNNQDFIPRLKDHLLAHHNNIPYDRDKHTFSDKERDTITFIGNRIYKHNVLHINYTTYDLRCAQDSINVCTHPYIMTLGHEDEEEETKYHPYWYAKVLGIFHVNMRRLGHMETKRMEFLWVHWFGHNLDYEGSFETYQLHRIGLTDSEDPTSYRFLNPDDVLWSVHLIATFSPNERKQEAQDSNDLDGDMLFTEFYYVSMYVICDLSVI